MSSGTPAARGRIILGFGRRFGRRSVWGKADRPRCNDLFLRSIPPFPGEKMRSMQKREKQKTCNGMQKHLASSPNSLPSFPSLLPFLSLFLFLLLFHLLLLLLLLLFLLLLHVHRQRTGQDFE